MPYGNIHTYGNQAFTIETNDKKQYYGPYELNKQFIEQAEFLIFYKIPVKFDINYKKYAGESNGFKRYFAINLTIELVI